ncbi:MAG TPA: hypothetical protein VEU29_00170 [Actinomycetota bacterium]|nr:hypothetical protein [Actinomycetota bacterium]
MPGEDNESPVAVLALALLFGGGALGAAGFGGMPVRARRQERVLASNPWELRRGQPGRLLLFFVRDYLDRH